MPPSPPPSRNPRPNPSFSSMPPSPPPRPSPHSPSSQPKAEATSRPEVSAAAAEGTAKTTTPLPMPLPKPSPSSQLDEETMPDASAERTTILSGLSREEAENSDSVTEMAAAAEQRQQQWPHTPYAIPAWSAAPYHPFFLEVTKKGESLGRFDVSKKGSYMFGRIDRCDFVLEHPSISNFHAVLQYRNDGEVFLYDLGSTRGSFVNNTEIKKRSYMKILVGDVISFGQSSRLYAFVRSSEPVPLIMEEIKNLEETLTDSIQGTLGARASKQKCGSHRAIIKEDFISSEEELIEMSDSPVEKKNIITGNGSKWKLVEEYMNFHRDNANLQDDGCSRAIIQRKASSLTTIASLPEDTLLEIFSRLPSIGCVIRAACSCSVWKNLVASSPIFRRKFLEIHPAPLLGLFFDPPSNIAPAFPTFVPARNAIVDVPVAVRWGDFFITELQREPVVPPKWSLLDARGGLMLLGTDPRILQAHLVCDEAYTGRFTLICFAHDNYRVRAAVFGSSIGCRGFVLPWFEVATRQNHLDGEGGWLTEGVQAGKYIYWLSTNHQYVVMLDTGKLIFSVEHLPELNLDDLDSYTFGETKDGKLCLAYIDGPRLVIMCCQNSHTLSEPWDVLHEAHLHDLAFVHGELRVAGIRKGIAYLMASRIFHQYGIPCWIATYDTQTSQVEVKCQWMSTDNFQPFHLPWPRSLSSQGQASAAKAQRHLQKFQEVNVVKDIILVKAIYSCQIDVMKEPQNYQSWYNYINLEKNHGDQSKVKAIYEQALSNPPAEEEKWFWDSYVCLWLSYAIYEEEEGDVESARKDYLFFEISENEVENARALFEKLLIVTQDVEAWISYAKYEASDDSNNSEMDQIQKCRSVFERALEYYSNSWESDERAKLMKAWSEHEKSFGVSGIAISPDHIMSSRLKRKSISSAHEVSTEKRRKKDAGDERIPL